MAPEQGALVGRAGELGALAAAGRGVRGGSARVGFVSGEPATPAPAADTAALIEPRPGDQGGIGGLAALVISQWTPRAGRTLAERMPIGSQPSPACAAHVKDRHFLIEIPAQRSELW